MPGIEDTQKEIMNSITKAKERYISILKCSDKYKNRVEELEGCLRP